jgi:ketosteroid isomerase-like protein
MPMRFSVLILSSSLLGASVAAPAKDEPTGIVRSFHDALSSGSRDRALAALDPAVVIFEQGGAEMSRDEYAAEHLGADIEFSRSTSSTVVDQRIQATGKSACVLTISETSGTFRGKDVSSRNAETMLLERKSGRWRIVHIHWSSYRQDNPQP